MRLDVLEGKAVQDHQCHSAKAAVDHGVHAGGQVTALYGTVGTGLTSTGATVIHQDTSGVPGTAESGDAIGTAVSVGDYNADVYADALTGVPNEDITRNSVNQSDAGTSVLLKGSSTGLTGAGAQAISQDTSGVPGSTETGDNLGSSVSLTDLSGYGRADLTIGAAGEARAVARSWPSRVTAPAWACPRPPTTDRPSSAHRPGLTWEYPWPHEPHPGCFRVARHKPRFRVGIAGRAVGGSVSNTTAHPSNASSDRYVEMGLSQHFCFPDVSSVARRMSARAGPRRANLPALAVRQQRRPLRRVGRGRGSWRGRLAGDERHRRHARVGLGQPQVLADRRVVAGGVREAGGLVERPPLDAFDLLGDVLDGVSGFLQHPHSRLQ